MTVSRFSLFLFILLCLSGALGLPARALRAASAGSGNDSGAAAQQRPAQAEDQGSEEDQYRHSASVRLIAKWVHLDQEAAARLFEYLNFAILGGAILFALLKYLPKTFRANRKDIQHRLVDARTATQEAKERLNAIEQKLSRLDAEIAAIRQQAEKDSVEDEARIKASIETERQRIVAAASQDIAAAASAAQRDLKRFTAGLAVDRAAHRLALTADDDRELVREFSHSLSRQTRDGGQN